MATKLYVGNLSYDATDQSLTSLFSQVGTVTSAQIITDRYTGQSRGFGFVEMSTDAEAQSAIATLNGKQQDGRALTVNESRPRESGGGGGGGGGRSGGGGSRY
jgi:cold-inducible RNA-binding protein